jgi:hypothetical protein
MVIGAILVVSNLFEKTSKVSEATQPPSVGHLNPPIGRDGQKKDVLKNEK